MEFWFTIILFGAGLGGGVLSALVGGAGLITFPALIAAGVPPVLATASNTTALVPGNLSATFADRKQLPKFGGAFVLLLLTSLLGSGVGAALLLLTPERVFVTMVPILLGFGTVLFAFSGAITDWLRKRSAAPDRDPRALSLTSAPLLLPASIYNGYFGIASAILLLSVLSISSDGNYRAANAMKNLFSGLNGLAAALFFTFLGAVDWPRTVVLMAGAIIGGLLGVRIAQVLPRRLARAMVIGFGALLTVVYASRSWF